MNDVLTPDPRPARPRRARVVRRDRRRRSARSSKAASPTCRPRASSSRCGPRARPRASSRRWSARCTTTPPRVDVAAGRHRHVRHRRRPRGHGQRLDDGRADRGGRGRACREARQSRRVVALRIRRRARSARRRDRARARRRRARASTTAGVGFCFAPRYHPAMRFLGPARKELGVPTTFNFLGPLAEPGRRAPPGDRRLRSGDGADDARRAAGARRRARAGVPRRRRPRRAHDHHDEHRARAGRRRPCASTPLDPLDFGLARADAAALARRRRGDERRRASARSWPATRARARDIAVLNAAAAARGRRASPPTSEPGSRSRPRPSTADAPPARSMRWSASARTRSSAENDGS